MTSKSSQLNNNQQQSHDECTSLKKQCEEVIKENNELKEEVLTLRKTIQELEDWNGDFAGTKQPSDSSPLQSTIDSLTSRNRQLENDLQRLQHQQKNNQLALERLDEYEDAISQLQDQLDQERSNKKKSQTDKDGDINRLLEVTRRELEEQIQSERNEHIEKENNRREIFERQLTELNEEVHSLENDKIDLNNQLDELRLQLQSRETQIQSFQSSAATPGSPPMISSSQFDDNKQQLTSIHEQFLTLLPGEYVLSDNPSLSLIDRFINLFEQYSTYLGTFSIIQEELDSLKQILIEKQDELEKLRAHFQEQQQQQQPLKKRTHFYESDDDDEDEHELEEILDFNQRAPSRQSLASITPGEKQQLIAQNELLSTLLTEKEQELIFLQQTEKTREEVLANLRLNLQQLEAEKETKQMELNDIRNVLDEKLRENSSLKKEKMYFIDKLAEFERERQTIIHVASKQTSPEREKSPAIETTKIGRTYTQEQYDELLELSQRQHEESLSYYNEYTRIVTLYNELNTKYSQLQVDYESVQSLIQQKNEAYLQCQNELNTFQNLLYHQKKKSDDIDLLTSTLNERDQQLQQLMSNEKELLSRQTELEAQVKLLEENSLRWKSNQQLFDQIQIDLKRSAHERDLAIVEKKQLENEMQINREKVFKLEEFQKEREQYINETNEMRQRLEDCNQEHINKDLLITQLQSDINSKIQQIVTCQENFQSSNGTRVEKQLVKNILLSYFQTPIDKQQEVIPILSALVGFTKDEYDKTMDAISTNYANSTSSGWLSGWLGGYSVRPKMQSNIHSDKSFAELLIQYVDQQSTTTILNPDECNAKSSLSSTSATEEQSNVEQDNTSPTQSTSINIDKILTI
ncbi:hypothetical protein I4U23_003339 [Adineta vaga]|nr:hypothetical protein I4U23_003339 [Adineta vaga]